MFNLFWPELVLIAVVALLLFGPQRIPDVARSIGQSLKAFKDGLKEGFEEKTAPPSSEDQAPSENHQEKTPVV